MGEFNKNRFVFSNMSMMFEVSEEVRKIREKQISFMLKDVVLHKIEIRDLINVVPSIRDRNILLNVSMFCIEEYEIYERIQRKRELPLNLIVKKTKLSRAFLELWYDYILFYVVILSNPNYKHVQEYILVEDRNETQQVSAIPRGEEGEKKGLVLKENRHTVIVLTRQGEVLKLKKKEDILVGTEFEGNEKKGIRHYKPQIALVSFFIIVVLISGYFKYTKEVSVIVMDTTSQIKYEINVFNKVTYAFSPTEKGKLMISEIKPRDKNIDEAIYTSLVYASENNMIPNKSILITVSGEALEYGILQQTAKYAKENNINILVNNAGSQHNLKDIVIEEKE